MTAAAPSFRPSAAPCGRGWSRAGLALLLIMGASGARAEWCPDRPRTGRDAPERRCGPDERLRPYDPDAARRGRSPGSIDLGNGTEVRIGGRVQMEYDVRRR